MVSRTLTRLIPAVCAAILVAPSQAAPKNPADSFLQAPSSGVAAVVHQVETNPTVRRHYAKYFHIPESQVANYLRHNLRQTRLAKTGRYTMYLVRSNGLIYPTIMTIPKGAPVFTLQTKPVALLTYREGNPIKDFKPQVVTVIVKAPPSYGSTTPTVKVSPSKELQVLAPVKVQETILPTIVGTPVYRPASPLSPDEQAPETYAPPPVVNP